MNFRKIAPYNESYVLSRFHHYQCWAKCVSEDSVLKELAVILCTVFGSLCAFPKMQIVNNKHIFLIDK
jgi:hypothetical protein